MKRSTLNRTRRLAQRGCFALRPLPLAAALLILAEGAMAQTAALPSTGTVVYGNVTTTQPNANTLNIHQTSDKAYVQYDSFSIGLGNKVVIQQPTSTSAFLGQVTGYDPSFILGQLQANGRVFLINPNGIVFGEHARVDVGSIVATTMSLSLGDFLNNRILLTSNPTDGHGALAGVVRNDGTITAKDGFVVLAGRQVINTGQILAENGRVGLAAASKLLVDVEGDGLLFFEVEGKDAGARLAQLGRIEANGGSVEMMADARGQFADTVLNMSGVVQARSLGTKQGRVVIDGGSSGITDVSGSVDTTGVASGQKGGDITVTGDRVLVRDGASLDASGDAGGGRLLVGGDFHGANPAVRNAQVTAVGAGARLRSNALQSGQGGDVVVWADDTTRYFGSIESKGGAQGGNGGAVEVSGKQSLAFQGAVDTSAPKGQVGTLLLDPRDISITANGAALDWTAAAGVAAPGDAEVNVASINAATANVSLVATRDASVDAAINITNAGTGLSITAGRDLTVAESVSTNNGAVQLVATTGTIKLNNDVSAGTADVTMTGALTLGGAGATRSLTGGNVSVGAVTGAGKNLTLVAGTAATLGGAVAGVGTLDASASATTAINADVTTTAGQSYSAVTLGGAGATRTLSGTTVSVGAVTGGTKNLTLSGSTSATLGGAVAGVGTLDTSASATTAINADVTTTAGQSYGAVTLGGAGATRTLSGTTVSVGAVTGGAKDLTLIGSTSATLGGAVAGVGTLDASASGTTAINADVTTTAGQSYGAVTLGGVGATRTLSGTTLALGAVTGGAKNLTLSGSTSSTLGGAVAGVGTLNASGSATTAINADVTTTAGQSYGAVTLGGAGATRTLSGTTLALGTVTGGAKNLTLTATTSATLGGAVSGVNTLDATGALATSVAADVSTTAGQSYGGAVTLTGPSTFTGTSVGFNNLVAAANNVAIHANAITVAGAATGTGTLGLAGATDAASIGVNSAVVTDLSISTALLAKFSGFSTLIIGTNTGVGNISFGDITLPFNTLVRSSSGDVSFAKVDGAHSLGVQTTTGTIELNDLIGGTTALTGLDLNGPVTVNTSLVKTAGDQTYGGAVTLAATTSLESGAGKISLASVDGGGANDLTLKSANGAADAIKTTGTISNLRALSVEGAATLGGNVTTTGDQTYTGMTTLASNVTLDATAAKVSLAGVTGATNDLTVKSSNAAADAIKTTAAISGVAALNLQGKTTLGANVGSTGAQDYAGAVTLASAVAVTSSAGNVRFQSTVDGAQALTVNAAGGNVRFDGAVGSGMALSSLGVTAGSVNVNAGAITTTGGQTYTTPNVTLESDTTFTASSLTATGNVDAGVHDVSVFADAMNVAGVIASTGAGNASIAGRLASTTIGVAGGAGTFQVTSALLNKFSNFGSVTVGRDAGTGNITFGNMTGGTALNRSLRVRNGSGDIVFGQIDTTVDGSFNLNAATATGTVRLNGDVGGISRLNSLTLGGPTRIAASNIFTAGFQRYNGPVTLVSDVSMNATSATFGSTVNGAHHLTVTPLGGGYAYFIGAVGGTAPLASLTVNGTTYVENNVTTSGAQYYGGTTVLFNDATFTGTALTFNGNLAAGTHDLGLLADSFVVNGTVSGTGAAQIAAYTAGRNTVVKATGGIGELVVGDATFTQFSTFSSVTVGRADGTGSVTLGTSGDSFALPTNLTLLSGTGDISVLSDISGAHSLNLNTSGTTRINASASGLTSLATDAGGTTRLGASVTTSGTQTYGDAVILDASVGLSASDVHFVGKVDGASAGAQSLTIGGNARFGAAVGSTQSLGSLYLTSLGASVRFDNGGAHTSGYQYYSGVTTLGADSAFTSDTNYVFFGGALNGAHALTTSSASATYFNSAVGNTSALTSVNVTGQARLNGGSVTTTGAQTYAGSASLGADTTLTGTDIALNGAVDGARALAINASGTTTLGGIVGAPTALTSLSTSGATNLNGGSIRTTGAQSYGGAVTLGANTTVTANTVDFNGTVNGSRALVINDSGTTTFHGNVGNTAALGSLVTTAGGSTVLPAQVTTTGAQVYGDPVTLSANTTLSANSVSLANLIGANHALAIATPGLVDFNGTIAGLTGLDKTGTGTVRFIGAQGLTTSGAQSYGGNVQVFSGNAVFDGASLNFAGDITGANNLSLSSDVISVAGAITGSGAGTFAIAPKSLGTTIGLSGGTGALQVNLNTVSGFTQRVIGRADGTGTVNVGASTLSANTTVQSGTGAINFGALDGAQALTVNTAGVTSFNGNVTGLTTLSTDAAGSTNFNGSSASATTALSFGDAVVYGGNVSFTAPSITLGGGASGGANLTLATNTLSLGGDLSGSGELTLQPTAAGTTIGLAGGVGDLQITQATLNRVTGFTSQTIGRTDGTGAINANAMTLARDTKVQSATGNVAFNGTVDGARALVVNTAGTTAFNGDVGGTTALASLSTNAGGTTAINASQVRATGALHFGDAVTTTGDTTFSSNSQQFDGGVTGGANLTLVANTLTSGGPISGSGILSILPLSATTIGLAGAGGGGDLLISQALLDQTSGFTQLVIGANTGAVNIESGALTLGVDTTLQSGTGQVHFQSTVDGAHTLTVNTAGLTRFQGNVGSTTALASVTTDAPGSTQIDASAMRTTGAQTYNDPVTTSGVLSLAASTVTLHTVGNLRLGLVNLGLGGDISTDGVLTLEDSLNLGGGTLTLQAGGGPGAGIAFNDSELSGRPGLISGNLLVKEAAAAILQTNGTITTAASSTLDLKAVNRGSIRIDHTTNEIAGNLKAVSGPEGDTNTGRFSGSGTLPLSFVRVDSNQIRSAGIEADAVKLTANSLSTNPGTKIRARLPYINAQGIESSVAALTMVLKQPTVINQFGTPATSSWIQVDVGDSLGGYLTVRPKGAGAGSSAVYVGGSEGNVPFYDGTSKASEIQVYYNGRVPSTPQEVGALSAVTAVIEESRRARFDEAVRTENVSSRLRTGVIAEVGAGRPATEGSESIRMPATCTPTATLGCQ
ncbi:MAG: hypothetical protein C0487_05370 [Leptothrix sp. (in: Bacteria)]|nr:hypothetical protein [Leptothrix sp. (in: b-proteobacteria)]